MPSETPETQVDAFFDISAESNFIIRKKAANEAIWSVVKQMPVVIDADSKPEKTVQDAVGLIDEAIAEGIVPREERERLAKNTRRSYWMNLTTG